MSNKVDSSFVAQSYEVSGTVNEYREAAEEVGLWDSERIMMEKYVAKECSILDIGCGAGRTSLGLYKLGYSEIEAFDLAAGMVEAASEIAAKERIPINFFQADLLSLEKKPATYDCALFSYNGLMQIPGPDKRLAAVKRVAQLLKPGGHFIFTTHDREIEIQLEPVYWKLQKNAWENGKNEPGLFEFGDLYAQFKHSRSYLHIPTRNEVIELLNKGGFSLVEDRFRPEIADEPLAVKRWTQECRFWVAKKC